MPSQENLDENYQKQYTGSLEDVVAAEQADREQNEHEPQETTKDLTFYIPPDASIEERLMFMSYLGDATPLWHEQGETIVFNGVAAFDDWKRDENGVELLDEYGAFIPCKRTIWKTPQGKLYHSTSNVVYGWCKKALWPIMTQTGKPGDLVAPIKIRVGSRPTKNGLRTFKFDIVSE